jgi:DNA-3-methyladenine glycosylase
VTKEKDVPEAVLIRAIEPVKWIEYMGKNRKNNWINLTNWPWKLTKAFEIWDELNWKSISQFLQDNQLFIDYENSKTPEQIGNSTRIWIPNKWEWTNKKLRYFIEGNRFVKKA